jgi:ATP-binding cassette, subfamily B, bacterial AbcA/BmrA
VIKIIKKNRKLIKLIKLNKLFWLGLLCVLLSSTLNILAPLYIKELIDLSSIFKSPHFLLLILKLIVVLLVQVILSSIGNFLIGREGERQILNIRRTLEKHLISLPVQFYDNQNSGKLTSRVINDSVLIKNFVTEIIPNFITSLLTVIGTFVVLFILDWKLTFLIFIIFPIDTIFMIPLGKFEEKIVINTQNSLSDLSSITTESFRNIQTIKLNCAEDNILTKFSKKLIELYRLSVKSDTVYAVLSPIQNLISFVLIVLVLFYGGYRVQTGTLTVGVLTSFLIYFFQIINPVNVIMSFHPNYKQISGAVKKIDAILEEPTEKYINTKLCPKVKQPCNLEINNLSFAYEEKVILKNINMKFPAKQKISIVGPSGAGKTTLVKLITRLYEPSLGNININGINSRDFNLADWRGLFGVVSQDNYIVSGTIYDNLILGLTNAPSDQEIKKALVIANLTTFINSLNKGINTIVGEQGIKLSGGQRQKIQVARAYLKKPTFLILDEATSNLDANSEADITQALKQVMHGKTIITIAHRLSTVVDADAIYFLDDNKIIAEGNHSELLAKVPKYRSFVKKQMITMN